MQGFSGEGDKSEDLSVDGRIILKWILREVGWGHGLICLRIGTGGGSCKCGDESSGCIKCVEFLEKLRTC